MNEWESRLSYNLGDNRIESFDNIGFDSDNDGNLTYTSLKGEGETVWNGLAFEDGGMSKQTREEILEFD